MPTPPFNFARRSRNFSLSYSEVELLIYSLISSTLASISFNFAPASFMIIVSSLLIITLLHSPRTLTSAFSKVNPASSATTVEFVKIAISYIIAFLLSPNEGHLTAATFKLPFNLFKTSVARASLSKSSQIINKGLPIFIECSKNGKIY